MNRATKEALNHLKNSDIQPAENITEAVQLPEASGGSTNKQVDNSNIAKDESKSSEEKFTLFSKFGDFVKNITTPKKTETITNTSAKVNDNETIKANSIKEELKIETSSTAVETKTSPDMWTESDLSSPEKIKEFQKLQGIPVTGHIGDLTRKALKRIQQNTNAATQSSIEEMSPPINISSN